MTVFHILKYGFHAKLWGRFKIINKTDWQTNKLTNNLTKSMKYSPSWEANKFPADQDISCMLWKLKVPYRVHSSSPHAPVLSQINPVHALLRSVLFVFLLLSLCLLSGVLTKAPPPFRPPNFLNVSLLPHTCYMRRPISFSFILSIAYLVKSTGHEILHHAFSCGLFVRPKYL
jgi:hypothetical protein